MLCQSVTIDRYDKEMEDLMVARYSNLRKQRNLHIQDQIEEVQQGMDGYRQKEEIKEFDEFGRDKALLRTNEKRKRKQQRLRYHQQKYHSVLKLVCSFLFV